MSAPLTVLAIDGSPTARQSTAAPIEAAGASCELVPDLRAALDAAVRRPPTLMVADAAAVAREAADVLVQLKARAQVRDTPLVIVAPPSAPAELLENLWKAGADDLVIGPMRLAHVQARLAAVAAGASPPPRDPRRTRQLLLVAPPGPHREALGHLLELDGFHLRYASSELDTLALGATGGVDLVIVTGGERGDQDLLKLRAVRKTLKAPPPALIVAARPPPPDAEREPQLTWVDRANPIDAVVQAANQVCRKITSQLRATERVAFFRPVEARERGGDPKWLSGFSYDLSPGGLFVKTLIPVRHGATVELRIHLPRQAPLEGEGVVAWANAYARRSVYTYPVGMGVQFLGMSPSALARVRELCQAEAAR